MLARASTFVVLCLAALPSGTVALLAPRLLPRLPVASSSRSRVVIASEPTVEDAGAGAETLPPALGDAFVGKVLPTRSDSPTEQGELAQATSADSAADTLLELVTGGTGLYAKVFWAVLVVGLHAILAFGTLSGVLLDGAMGPALALPADVITFANSLVFFGWVPGALLGGPLGDRIGRKPALLAFSLVGAVGLCATGAAPAENAAWLLSARALTGVGMGGFVPPAFALLVETAEPKRTGQASVTWTWGYVGGVVTLCALHYGLSEVLHVGWRLEELALAGYIAACAAATLVLLPESPRFLLANGQTVEALQAARVIARLNGVDVDGALASDDALAPLRDAQNACRVVDDASGTDAPSADDRAAAAPTDARADNNVLPASVDAAVDTCEVAAEEELDWPDLFSARAGFLPITLTLGAMEVAYNLAFYVIVFSSGAISDQVLLNLILLAAADLPGSTAAGLATDRFGAKRAAVAFLAAAGSVLLTLAAYRMSASETGGAGVTVALSLLGKSLSSGAFTAIFVLFSTLYPVRLRSAALGSGNMFAKMGAAAAPLLTRVLPLPTSLGLAGCLLFASAAAATTLPSLMAMSEEDDTPR